MASRQLRAWRTGLAGIIAACAIILAASMIAGGHHDWLGFTVACGGGLIAGMTLSVYYGIRPR